MAITRGRLANIATVANSAGSVYSNPASTKTFISGITLHNSNTTAELVTVHNVPDSTGSLGTAAAGNRILRVSLDPNQTITYSFPGDGIVLEDTNDSIQAVTTTDSVVTIMIHGTKDV